MAAAAADGYAFPSVHAAVAVAAFGVLACLCAAGLRSWAGRVAIWTAAAALTALDLLVVFALSTLGYAAIRLDRVIHKDGRWRPAVRRRRPGTP